LQDGFTALHVAVVQGHRGMAEALLKAACNKDIQDKV
jgi:ankyrin repeat protein